MSSSDTFPQLLARVREGDEDAAAVIFRRFVDQLIAKAHRHLSPAVRRKADAEDVVQSVYRTFFRRVRDGEFQLDHWGSLWGLLTRITVRKCAHAGRGKNAPREVSISPSEGATGSSPDWNWQVLARDPSPEETAALNELLDSLLNPLRDVHREIVTLTLQGYTQVEIAKQLDCSERTVRRVITQVQADLEKLDLI